MGYSTAYTVFSGAAEVLGGALLFLRRTTTLGALVICAVMTNIVMLNFCYDVPVKLYSSHLLLMAAFLLIPDVGRLLDVLVWQRPTQPGSLAPPFTSRRLRRGALVVKLSFIGFLLYEGIYGSIESMKKYGDQAPKIAMHGLYDIEELSYEGQATPPRWRRISVTNYGLNLIERGSRRPAVWAGG